MDRDTEERERIREMFGLGRAGEPVPQVDPEDIKAVWKLDQEVKKDHPGLKVAIGVEIFERACKHGANVRAVTYRTQHIGMLQLILPDLMDPLLQDKPEAVFRAAAEIPIEWMGVGIVRDGLPFDLEDFVRRVREG
jgi:hypothetical protein